MIRLTNDFHGTSVILYDKAGSLSKWQVRKAARILCASDCWCADNVAGSRGKQFWGKGDERQQVWLSERSDGGAEIVGL